MQITRNTLAFGFLRRDHAPEQFAAHDLALLRLFQPCLLQVCDLAFRFHLKGTQETDHERRRGHSCERTEHLDGKTKKPKEGLLVDDIRRKNGSHSCKKLPK